MNVSDVMTREVTTVTRETPLKDAARLLAVNHFSGVPVVDDDGVVVGVLSEADILVKEGGPRDTRHGVLHWLLEPEQPGFEEKLEAQTAGEAMSSPPVTIAPGRPLREAANTMLDEGVNRLPVVDDDGRLVGLVTRGDLVRAFVRSDDAIRHEIETDVVRRILWVEDPAAIGVTVKGGVVTLEGEVATESDAELLPRFVERVPGVVAVESRLRYPTG
jgi:CBS domain-containing protein